MGTSYVPGGGPTVIASQSFVGNVLTSDPVRHARAAAVLEAEPALGLGSPTNAWASAAFSMMSEFEQVSYAGKIRQPILMIAAGRDETVSTAGDRGFRRPAARGLASHHRRLAPRDDDGDRSLSRAVLGGVRRVRSRHADVLMHDATLSGGPRSSVNNSCGRSTPRSA